MKHVIFIMAALAVGFIFMETSTADTGIDNLDKYVLKIEASMPKSWKVVWRKQDVIPNGHYDGLKYEGEKGIDIVLAGPENIFFTWKDKQGLLHKEPILKEAIVLWIMPKSYRLSWKRFFVFKRQVGAPLIYSGEVNVYGIEIDYWSKDANERLKEIMPNAASLGGTPESTVISWPTWRQDIVKILTD